MTHPLAGAAIVIGCCAAAFVGVLAAALVGRVVHQRWRQANAR